MVDDIYRKSFDPAQIQKDDDDFNKGFGDDEITLIKTPGAKRRNTGEAKTSVRSVPIASFSFMTKTFQKQKTKNNFTPSNRSRFDDSDFDPDLTEDEETEEKFNRCFSNAQRGARNLRSQKKKQSPDVASKEVINDGGVQPLTFVSLNEASRVQSEKNLKHMLLDEEGVCDTSCDELEEYILKIDQEEEKKKRAQRRKFFGLDDVAAESLDEHSGSALDRPTKKRRKTKQHDDDDGDDDDMYYSTEESIRTSQSKQKKYPNPDDTPQPSMSSQSSGASTPPSPPAGSRVGARPGRHTSSAVNCFFCRFGDKEYDAVSKDDMNKLLKTYEKGIGRVHPAALAKTIHKQYMSTLFKDDRPKGGKVPVWRTRSVLEHILYHDLDPRVVAWLNIIDTRRTIDCLSNTAFVREPTTGQLVAGQSTELKRKQEAHLWNIYKTKLENTLFYSQTSQIDLPKNNKRVDGCYQKKGPQHFAHTRLSGLDNN